jgi:hypothetical protein
MVHDRVLDGVDAGVVVVEVVGVVTVVVVEVVGVVTVGVVATEPRELDAPDEGDPVETGEVLVDSDVLPVVPAWDVGAELRADAPPANGLRGLPASGGGAGTDAAG